MLHRPYYEGDKFPTVWEKHFHAGCWLVCLLVPGSPRRDRPLYGFLASQPVAIIDGRQCGGEHDAHLTQRLQKSGILEGIATWEHIIDIDGTSLVFGIREADVQRALRVIEQWN